MLAIVSRVSLKSLRFAPSTARPSGTPRPSVRTLRLVPILQRSVGFLPTFFPPKGALVIAPSIASQAQSIPCKASYSTKPCSHKATKTSASTHSWKRRWAALLEQSFVLFSACHWHPVRSTKKMASIALRSSTRGRWHPKGCGFRGGSNGARRSHNPSAIHQSRRVFSWSFGLSTAPHGETFSPEDTRQLPNGIASQLDFIHLCGIAQRLCQPLVQCARDFYHVGFCGRHLHTLRSPQPTPDPCQRSREGHALFGVPGLRAHCQPLPRAHACGQQAHQRIQSPHAWRRPGH